MKLLQYCQLCPRKCGVNRYHEKGFCGATNRVRLAYYSLHMWEEPVISGENGSGTIFFSNLICVACIVKIRKSVLMDMEKKYRIRN